MELTQEVLNDCLVEAKVKFSSLQSNIIKKYKIGKDCPVSMQKLKALVVWEQILANYTLSEEQIPADCRIKEECLTHDQILSICDKIKNLTI